MSSTCAIIFLPSPPSLAVADEGWKVLVEIKGGDKGDALREEDEPRTFSVGITFQILMSCLDHLDYN